MLLSDAICLVSMSLSPYALFYLQVKEASQVVAGIAEGCRQSGAALIGGETAEMAGTCNVLCCTALLWSYGVCLVMCCIVVCYFVSVFDSIVSRRIILFLNRNLLQSTTSCSSIPLCLLWLNLPILSHADSRVPDSDSRLKDWYHS